MDAEHGLLVKNPDEEMNSSVRTQIERQLIKKRQNVFPSEFSEFFCAKLLYKKDGV